MSYGLQVWNASGGQILEVTDRLPRYVASLSHSANGQAAASTVYYSVPGATNDGKWFWVFKGLDGSSVATRNSIDVIGKYRISFGTDQLVVNCIGTNFFFNYTMYFDIFRV